MFRVAAALLSTFAGLVLLLSFKSHSASGSPRSALGLSSARPTTPGTTGTTDTTGTPGTSGTSRPKARRTTTAASGTYPGSAYHTRYGVMQVAAVVRAGKLTDVQVLAETDGDHSHQIDAAALPVLKSEALSAQSANIDVVSGATYTSTGYAHSLQSALDKAGL